MVIRPENPDKLLKLLREKPLVLYGLGHTGKLIAKWCGDKGITYVISDKRAVELRESGVENVVLPQDIVRSYPSANVVILSILYREEIMKDLLYLGIKEEQIIQPFIFMPNKVEWADMEAENQTDWDCMRERFQVIAEWGWIPQNVKSVADYGAGQKYIQAYLADSTVYYPIDYIDRGTGTIICDFNQREFPDIYAELSACIGVLMYIEPAKLLISHICAHTNRRIIFSYITLECMPDIEGRKRIGMCNHFTDQQVADLFAEEGYQLQSKRYCPIGSFPINFFLFERQ